MPGKPKKPIVAQRPIFDLVEMGMCKASELKRDPHNPRSKLGVPRPFLENIATYGVLEPLYVNEEFTIIEGNRRHLALETLGLLDRTVRVIVVTGDQEAARLAKHGGGLERWTGYDLAVECQRCIDKGMTIGDIAIKCCKHANRIQRGLAALAELRKHDAPANQFGLFVQAIVYGIDSTILARCILSGHVRRSSDVRKMRIVLQKFNRPWTSRHTIDQMYQSALERPLEHAL